MTFVSTQLKHVSRYRIDLPKSYKLLEMGIERYNAQFEKPKLKLPHIFLARELIRLYAMEFQRWQAARGFAVELDWKEMPLLATNNQFLAEITGRTGRSIRNYRKALESAGFMAPVGQDEEENPIFSVFHGRTSDFELAIAPEFLWIESNRSTARLRPRNAPTLCLRPQNGQTLRLRKNFPPTSTGTSTGTQQELQELVGGKKSSDAEKNSVPHAELLDNSASSQPEQPELPSGRGPEQPELVNRNEQSRPAAGEGAGPDRDAQELIRRTLIRTGAKILYNNAKAWLYPGEVFPKPRREAILARLAELFGNTGPDQVLFEKITRVYSHRLKLAQLYWHREYGAIPEPEVFFDTSNTENGFILTKKWPDDPKKYPPPPRVTYRMPNGHRRGAGRKREAQAIGNII